MPGRLYFLLYIYFTEKVNLIGCGSGCIQMFWSLTRELAGFHRCCLLLLLAPQALAHVERFEWISGRASSVGSELKPAVKRVALIIGSTPVGVCVLHFGNERKEKISSGDTQLRRPLFVTTEVWAGKFPPFTISDWTHTHFQHLGVRGFKRCLRRRCDAPESQLCKWCNANKPVWFYKQGLWLNWVTYSRPVTSKSFQHSLRFLVKHTNRMNQDKTVSAA